MAPSSRWCPTTEQLMILEEMYKGGVKTPNASQIQQITAHLSYYGKIEGKNVFYWFQNHKARERQKLRRRLCKQLQEQHQHQLYQQQQQQQQNYNQLSYYNHPLHYFDPPFSSGFHQLYNFNSVGFLPQGGDEDASANVMRYSWKVDLEERSEMDKSMARMYGGDWLMMMDVGPTTACSNRPLKTLELFPITATTSLKDECTMSN